MLLAATFLSCSAQDRDSLLMSHASNRSKVAPRKFNGTLLLKCLVASCLLSGIGAQSTAPCNPTTTSGCSPEIAEGTGAAGCAACRGAHRAHTCMKA